MDFDEFDCEDDAPLHERIARMAGKPVKARSPIYVSSDDEAAVEKKRSNESVALTPPPPVSEKQRKAEEAEAMRLAQRTVDNILNSKRSKAAESNNPAKDTENRVKENKENDNPPAKVRRKLDQESEKLGRAKKKEEKEKFAKLSKECKDAEKLVNKQTDKSEVNKYMLCVMDPLVVSIPPGPDILNMLTNPPTGKPEEVFQYKVENQSVPGSLTWKRRIIHLDIQGGQPVVSETWIEENRSLVFTSAMEIAEKILDGTLAAWAESIRQQLGSDHHLTLMVYNFNSYFRADKNSQERTRKAAVRGEAVNNRAQSKKVSEYSMLEALLTLSINRVLDYLTFDRASDKGWRECAGSVFHQTRAVAEAPEKLKKSLSSSSSFDFYAKAETKDCISPKNLIEYWKQVIMQVSTISLEKGTAIVRQYPSPCLLINAYRSCSSESEAEGLLADIEIRRTNTILGGTRRIGPEISKKVYLAFTSNDPTLLISS